jgi:hypothetical protein
LLSGSRRIGSGGSDDDHTKENKESADAIDTAKENIAGVVEDKSQPVVQRTPLQTQQVM